MAYHFDKLACTAQEAVDIAGHMSAQSTFYVLPAFVKELRVLAAAKLRAGSLRSYFACIDAAIFTAGRIQGIREERARQRMKRVKKEAKQNE